MYAGCEDVLWAIKYICTPVSCPHAPQSTVIEAAAASPDFDREAELSPDVAVLEPTRLQCCLINKCW